MIKLVYCVTRHAALGRELFLHTWLHEHGPLVRSLAEALGTVRYVQSHTLDSEINSVLATSRGMQAGYDGITELWFESVESLQAALISPRGAAAAATLLADEKRFIDLERSRTFIAEEHEVFG